MGPIQFAAEEVLLVFSGGVLETFHRSYDRSFRTPAAWLGVRLEPGRHDRLHVTVGRVHQGGPVYGPDVTMSWNDIKFDLGADDEPRIREFLDEVVRAVGP